MYNEAHVLGALTKDLCVRKIGICRSESLDAMSCSSLLEDLDTHNFNN